MVDDPHLVRLHELIPAVANPPEHHQNDRNALFFQGFGKGFALLNRDRAVDAAVHDQKRRAVF